jgi:signal transduction histidine kinase
MPVPGAHPVSIENAPDTMVLANPERIGQVLRNLLTNAAKYSPPGTPITLRASCQGDRVHIEVIDRGDGIHPEDLSRIFEKFGRGRDQVGRRSPGIGVGLYLSRRIIEAHGSELTVDSTLGVGSVFAFALEVVR